LKIETSLDDWRKGLFDSSREIYEGAFDGEGLNSSFAGDKAKGQRLRSLRKLGNLTNFASALDLLDYVQPIYGAADFATGGCDKELSALQDQINSMRGGAYRFTDCQVAVDRLIDVMACAGIDERSLNLMRPRAYAECSQYNPPVLEPKKDRVPFSRPHLPLGDSSKR